MKSADLDLHYLKGGIFFLKSYHACSALMKYNTFDLILFVPVNNFTVMLGWVFLG